MIIKSYFIQFSEKRLLLYLFLKTRRFGRRKQVFLRRPSMKAEEIKEIKCVHSAIWPVPHYIFVIWLCILYLIIVIWLYISYHCSIRIYFSIPLVGFVEMGQKLKLQPTVVWSWDNYLSNILSLLSSWPAWFAAFLLRTVDNLATRISEDRQTTELSIIYWTKTATHTFHFLLTDAVRWNIVRHTSGAKCLYLSTIYVILSKSLKPSKPPKFSILNTGGVKLTP